jgi:hypothetical protein
MEKSAVEWLIEELERVDNTFEKDSTDYTDSLRYAKEIAEEMEKQQIIDTYIECKKEYIVGMDLYPPQFVVDEAKQYYNQRFKNE